MLLAVIALLASPVRIIDASTVEVDLDRVRIQVGLGQGHVGGTEALASMAKRENALAAINGSFFEAYEKRDRKNPGQSLISKGRLIHKGETGSMIGFTSANQVQIGQPRWRLSGSRDGSSKWPKSWFAYWVNRFPTSRTVTIFTPEWGSQTGMTSGTGVVVQDNVVTSIGPGSQSIPRDGFVIYFQDAEPKMLDTFRVGQSCAYGAEQTSGDSLFWDHVMEGVGAGPQLVRDGKACPNPASEGFQDPKILTGGGSRSAIGFRGRTLYLVVSSGTMTQLAQKMVSLGCEAAMNLDGGDSSNLWAQGKSLRAGQRAISNALLILPK